MPPQAHMNELPQDQELLLPGMPYGCCFAGKLHLETRV